MPTMENIIAVGVAVVVIGGIITLVYRIVAGDREEKKLEQEVAQVIKEKGKK